MSKDAAARDELPIDAILDRVRAELSGSDRPPSVAASYSASLSSVIFVPLVEDRAPSKSESETWTIEDFEALDEEEFLVMAYRVLLGRDIDESGLTHYLPWLRQGRMTPVEILGALRFSAEGEERGVPIRGLKLAWYLDRATRSRILGPIAQLATVGRVVKRFQRRLAALDKREREMVTASNNALKAVRRNLAKIMVEAAAARTAADKLENIQAELAAARQLVAQETLQLRRFVDRASATLPSSPRETEQLPQINDHALDSLYLAFENRFRGSPSEISARQTLYIGLFQALEPIAAGGLVLDIGCGRGEWLELLGTSNIPARGIDLNSAMINQAKSKGLDAIEGNAIDYLRSQPENSIAAITGFHIVEHLSFNELVRLFDEAWRVLSPGGFILFETPNPENLVVGACTFHYDPTHNRPLPPDFMRFLAEARGYGEVRIIRSEGDCDLSQPESGFTPTEINDWFRQPPDYALFARKRDMAAEISEEG